MTTAAETTVTRTDGYIMGAGRWTCADALNIVQNGSPSQKGQLAGWILGFWSSATLSRETGFVNTVERVGGEKVYTATLTECQKAPGSTLLYRVASEMIKNTN
jgi:hypothetical protein